MAEMELFIKPIFARETIDKFTDDVERSLGEGGGGSGGAGGTEGPAVKEQKKQTGLLEQIGRFTKVAATASLIATGLSLLPGAVNAGKSIGDTRENRLERAFRGGENYSDSVADSIESGKDLNEVLDEQMIIQEAVDQGRRLATSTLEDDTAAQEDAIKTINDLKATYVEMGGTLDDFDDQVSSLAAKDWVDGDGIKAELDIIDEAFDGTKEKIGDVAAGVDEYANETQLKMQEVSDNVENNFGQWLDRTEVKLKALSNAFNEVPIIKGMRLVIDVLQEMNNKAEEVSIALKAISESPGFGFGTRILAGAGSRILDGKKSGDSVP